MTTGAKVIESIKSTAEQIMPIGSTVLLYGSRSRGDFSPDSDWDILILLDKDRISNEDYDRYAFPFVALGWEMGEELSTIIYSKKQWQSYGYTPFYKNVENEKKSLYES